MITRLENCAIFCEYENHDQSISNVNLSQFKYKCYMNNMISSFSKWKPILLLHRAWESWSGNLKEYLSTRIHEHHDHKHLRKLSNFLSLCMRFMIRQFEKETFRLHEYYDRLFGITSFKNKAKFMSTMIPHFLENFTIFYLNAWDSWSFNLKFSHKVHVWGVSTMIRKFKKFDKNVRLLFMRIMITLIWTNFFQVCAMLTMIAQPWKLPAYIGLIGLSWLWLLNLCVKNRI